LDIPDLFLMYSPLIKLETALDQNISTDVKDKPKLAKSINANITFPINMRYIKSHIFDST